MKKSIVVLIMLSLTLVLLLPLGSISAFADTATTKTYSDVTLSGGYQAGNFPEVWDLTCGDLVITSTVDLNGMKDLSGAHAWSELGLRNVGAGNFNPAVGSGVWLATDYDWTVGTFGPDPVGAPTLDMDDKLILQRRGGFGEGDYDLPSTPPTPGNNHRVWFDRDGVDQSQALSPLAINGGTYNTLGKYNVVLTLHANGDTTGTAYMTINNLNQGFETDGDWNTMELTPAGMTFTGNMKQMQVFYGIYGYGATHIAEYQNISVTGCPCVIKVTADAQTKVYGEADPDPLTYACDTQGVTFNGALDRADGEDVGEYAIGKGTLSAVGYTIDFVEADLNITPKGITVTADPQTKVYGEADPPLTYTYIPALVDGDSFSGELIRDTGEDVGTYKINQGDLDAGPNYSIDFVGADLTINKPVVLTVTAITPSSLGNGKGTDCHKRAAVTISGFNFVPGAKVVIVQSGVLHPKKLPVKVTFISADGSTITCNLNLTSAAPGLYDVVVTNPDKTTATLAAGLTVNPHPVVAKPHTRYSGKIGTSPVSLTLTGTYFVSGATVKLTKGSFPDIPVSNVVVSADGTTLTCDLDLTNAHLSFYRGVVTNPDGGIGTFHFIGTK